LIPGARKGLPDTELDCVAFPAGAAKNCRRASLGGAKVFICAVPSNFTLLRGVLGFVCNMTPTETSNLADES
jgi:hypothetical protein